MSKIEIPRQVGKYEVRGLVGKGAMGVVYSAVDPDLGRPVAIKTMSIGDSPHEAEMRLRFLREGRSAGMLQHPNIITVHELFEEGGTAFLVMELLEGASLSSLIRRKKNLSLGERLAIIEQIASGLAEAHMNGIVHRDLKPSNVFVLRTGVAKVLDFGVAKVGEGGLTKAGTVFGTVEYMAPEQVRGQIVTARADIFSLGVVAYELLTGTNPFRAETLAASVFKIVSDMPATIPNVPAEVEAVIFRALEKTEEARFQSMSELRDALEAAAASAHVTLKRPSLIDADIVVAKERIDASVAAEPRVSQWSHVAAQADLLEELFQQGLSAFQSGDHDTCIDKMSQVLDAVPMHTMALHYLATSEENVRKARLDDDARKQASVLLTAMREAHRAGESETVTEKANALLAIDKASIEARWYRRHAEARVRGATVGGASNSFGYAPATGRSHGRSSASAAPPGPTPTFPNRRSRTPSHADVHVHVKATSSASASTTASSGGSMGLWLLAGVGLLFLALVGMWLSALGGPKTPTVSADRTPAALPGVRTSPFDGMDDDGTVVLQITPSSSPARFAVERAIPTSLHPGEATKVGLFGSGFSSELQISVESGADAAEILSVNIVSAELIELELIAVARVEGASVVVLVGAPDGGPPARIELGVSGFDTN